MPKGMTEEQYLQYLNTVGVEIFREIVSQYGLERHEFERDVDFRARVIPFLLKRFYHYSDNLDVVNHPSHYGGDTPYEVIKVLDAWDIKDPYIWQAIKYLARAGKKTPGINGTLEDFEKAEFYLKRRIDSMR
jgi:hypothetical protein